MFSAFDVAMAGLLGGMVGFMGGIVEQLEKLMAKYPQSKESVLFG